MTYMYLFLPFGLHFYIILWIIQKPKEVMRMRRRTGCYSTQHVRNPFGFCLKGYCERKKTLNLEKTTSSVRSVFLLIYDWSDKGFKDTVDEKALPFFLRGSLIIMLQFLSGSLEHMYSLFEPYQIQINLFQLFCWWLVIYGLGSRVLVFSSLYSSWWQVFSQ